MNNEQIAMRVSTVTIIGNAALSIFKFLAGIFGHSNAMISDAVHSFSDVLSTVIVMIGVKVSNKEEDASHPYGHERLECVAALILSMMLAVTGLGIGGAAIKIIINQDTSGIQIPSTLALVAAIISIIVKEWMFWYTKIAAKKINSNALLADAWHHRSDALSSIGSFIGIFGAQMGFPLLDPIASLIICLFILKVAFDIFVDSIDKMVDHSCDEKTVEEIHDFVLEDKQVKKIDDLKTRLFGNRIYVDIEIALDGAIALQDAHKIAETTHDRIETQFPLVKHCMVHVNPYKD